MLTPPDTFISFASDDHFLGAVVVALEDHAAALARVNALGLNPGGEALAFSVLPARYPHEILLCKEDLAWIHGKSPRSLGEISDSEREDLLRGTSTFCECCGSRLG